MCGSGYFSPEVFEYYNRPDITDRERGVYIADLIEDFVSSPPGGISDFIKALEKYSESDARVARICSEYREVCKRGELPSKYRSSQKAAACCSPPPGSRPALGLNGFGSPSRDFYKSTENKGIEFLCSRANTVLSSEKTYAKQFVKEHIDRIIEQPPLNKLKKVVRDDPVGALEQYPELCYAFYVSMGNAGLLKRGSAFKPMGQDEYHYLKYSIERAYATLPIESLVKTKKLYEKAKEHVDEIHPVMGKYCTLQQLRKTPHILSKWAERNPGFKVEMIKKLVECNALKKKRVFYLSPEDIETADDDIGIEVLPEQDADWNECIRQELEKDGISPKIVDRFLGWLNEEEYDLKSALRIKNVDELPTFLKRGTKSRIMNCLRQVKIIRSSEDWDSEPAGTSESSSDDD